MRGPGVTKPEVAEGGSTSDSDLAETVTNLADSVFTGVGRTCKTNGPDQPAPTHPGVVRFSFQTHTWVDGAERALLRG